MSHKSLFMGHSATRSFWTYTIPVICCDRMVQSALRENAPKGKVWQSGNGRHWPESGVVSLSLPRHLSEAKLPPRGLRVRRPTQRQSRGGLRPFASTAPFRKADLRSCMLKSDSGAIGGASACPVGLWSAGGTAGTLAGARRFAFLWDALLLRSSLPGKRA